MKKLIMAVIITTMCSGLSFAENMAGKIGVGLRNDVFDVRYFVNDHIGVHAGTALQSLKPKGGSKSTEYDFNAGGFYSKEITDGLMFQTGLTVGYHTGKDAGVEYDAWNYNPYLGAEFVYKGRFGLDFKIIPVQYYTGSGGTGPDYTAWGGGYGSLGAHIYF